MQNKLARLHVGTQPDYSKLSRHYAPDVDRRRGDIFVWTKTETPVEEETEEQKRDHLMQLLMHEKGGQFVISGGTLQRIEEGQEPTMPAKAPLTEKEKEEQDRLTRKLIMEERHRMVASVAQLRKEYQEHLRLCSNMPAKAPPAGYPLLTKGMVLEIEKELGVPPGTPFVMVDPVAREKGEPWFFRVPPKPIEEDVRQALESATIKEEVEKAYMFMVDGPPARRRFDWASFVTKEELAKIAAEHATMEKVSRMMNMDRDGAPTHVVYRPDGKPPISPLIRMDEEEEEEDKMPPKFSWQGEGPGYGDPITLDMMEIMSGKIPTSTIEIDEEGNRKTKEYVLPMVSDDLEDVCSDEESLPALIPVPVKHQSHSPHYHYSYHNMFDRRDLKVSAKLPVPDEPWVIEEDDDIPSMGDVREEIDDCD